MYAKSWAIKTFIAEFLTILLNEFPIAFDRPVLARFSIPLIHDLNTNTSHSPAEMLYNVKTIEDDFSIWKELYGDGVVGDKHVNSNDLTPVSDLSRIAKEMIANRCLSPPVQDCDDLERVKILRNEAHFSLLDAS